MRTVPLIVCGVCGCRHASGKGDAGGRGRLHVGEHQHVAPLNQQKALPTPKLVQVVAVLTVSLLTFTLMRLSPRVTVRSGLCA
eukprot:COSAG02_NODE_41722_length_391_cov_1.376712_1_plen_82_part_10